MEKKLDLDGDRWSGKSQLQKEKYLKQNDYSGIERIDFTTSVNIERTRGERSISCRKRRQPAKEL